METYHGHVRTPGDAIILFEACRIGLLPRVQRRLSEKERQSIKSGSVFVWDEREAGMRRWTDGKSWSASRVSGPFLTYREMEGKRGGSSFDKTNNPQGQQGPELDSDGGPDGYRYKPDGLMKQSFSIATNGGQHLHLISYYSRSSQQSAQLIQPTNDPQLRHIRPEKGMYPESTVNEQSTIPAVTRGPMNSPGYNPQQYGRPPYYPGHPGAWPPSPMHTPPPHPHYGPYGYAPHPAYGMQYPPPYGPQMTAFDRPPPHMSNTGLPPPPHQYSGVPPQAGYPGYGPGYQGAYGSYQPPPIQNQPYPQQQQQQPQQQQTAAYNPPPLPTPVAAVEPPKKDDRQDSTQTQQVATPAQPGGEKQAQPSATSPSAPASTTAPATSGQTIPSIHTMLNSSEGGQPPVRASSRSPNGGARAPSDIPMHKLGFEASRDMQALRNLDKTTFKAY